MNYVIGALAGLVWGALGAYLNSLITKKCLAAGDEKAIVGMNLAHMAVDIAVLAIVYLLRKTLPFSYEAMLIGTAAALSIVTIIFSYSIANKEKK